MAYELPTSDEVKARFTEFASADDDFIDLLIEEAARAVDESWIEGDYKPAILFLTAHKLAASAQQATVALGAQAIKSFSVPQLSATYVDQIKADVLTSSNYGSEFLALRKKNFPGFVMVG